MAEVSKTRHTYTRKNKQMEMQMQIKTSTCNPERCHGQNSSSFESKPKCFTTAMHWKFNFVIYSMPKQRKQTFIYFIAQVVIILTGCLMYLSTQTGSGKRHTDRQTKREREAETEIHSPLCLYNIEIASILIKFNP